MSTELQDFNCANCGETARGVVEDGYVLRITCSGCGYREERS